MTTQTAAEKAKAEEQKNTQTAAQKAEAAKQNESANKGSDSAKGSHTVDSNTGDGAAKAETAAKASARADAAESQLRELQEGKNTVGRGLLEEITRSNDVGLLAHMARAVFAKIASIQDDGELDVLRRELSTDTNVVEGVDVMRRIIREPTPMPAGFQREGEGKRTTPTL